MNKKLLGTKIKLSEIYNKYRAFCDCKAEAKPLALFFYCFFLNPKLMPQSDFVIKSLPSWSPLYRTEELLANSIYIVRKVGMNYTQYVHRIRLKHLTTQSRIDDLTFINSEHFQRDPSLRHFRGEPTLCPESILSLLEPAIVSQNVTENPPPVTVSFCFRITSATVPVGLAAAPAPLHPFAVAVASAMVAFDTADVEVAEPQTLERPQHPTQDARVSDGSDVSLPNDSLHGRRALSETPHCIDPVEQRLPAEANPTDRQPSRHHLFQNLHPINFCETHLRRKGTPPQTNRFQPACSSHF